MPAKYQYDLPLECDDEDRDAFLFLKDFKDNIEEHVEKGHGVFLSSHGKGNGKTSWACKIMSEYFRKVALTNNLRCRGLFINVPEFLDILRNNMDDPSEDVAELQDEIRSADLVIWDDIGTEIPTKWVRQTLYKFINYRESNGKAQIYTSNIKISALSDEDYLGDRIVDRIYGQCEIIEFVGSSRRDASWSNYRRRP
jgi:DNA replication protein DnaC